MEEIKKAITELKESNARIETALVGSAHSPVSVISRIQKLETKEEQRTSQTSWISGIIAAITSGGLTGAIHYLNNH
ncbi:MAG: hypothetical protein K9G46_07145 [Flavobacteriales bacterium]|nr:hypothetical protein [Flavobacteriales bacterium]